MRRLMLIVVAAVAGGAAPVAHACQQCGGCPPSACGTTSASVPGSGLLFVRNAGQRGPLAAYDVATGRRAFSLPAGIVSADGRSYLSTKSAHGVTTLRSYDARRGSLRFSWSHAGNWNAGGLSANGRWLALVRPAKGMTRIELLKGQRTMRSFTLHGWFDVDAVSNDGRRVFLIQYVRAGYLIRSYDVASRSLASRPLTEKGVPMTGTAWDAVASRDGRRLLTLYLRGDGAAEVHTLDLGRGTAICIDLPRGDALEIQQYALALSPDGRTLFAANPALGAVATVDLRTRRVIRTFRFGGHNDPAAQSPSAVTSHDGRTIYFTAGRKLYAYDAAYKVVRGAYDPGGPVSGIAFSPDDRRLLVIRRDGTALQLAAATGRTAR